MTTKKGVKTATKKTVATSKKRSTKSPKRVLARAEGAQCFWVNDGAILADLAEFSNALEKMSADTFAYHVSGSRNDFADWVEFVLGDTELALALRGVMKPKSARSVVVRRLKIYGLS
jgi:hypothetical protein